MIGVILLSMLCFDKSSLLFYAANPKSLVDTPLIFIESAMDALIFLYPLLPAIESRVETIMAFGESESRNLLSEGLSGVIMF